MYYPGPAKKTVKFTVIETKGDIEYVTCDSNSELSVLSHSWHTSKYGRWPTLLEEVSNDGKQKVIKITSKMYFPTSLD